MNIIFKKILFATISALLVFTFVIVIAYYTLIYKKINMINVVIQPAVKSVLYSIYESKITGEYWENEMLSQYNTKISNLDVSDRLEYYLAMIIYGDLDTSRAILFVEMVGKDTLALSDYLPTLEYSNKYSNLNESQRQNIIYWSNEMKRLSEVNKVTH